MSAMPRVRPRSQKTERALTITNGTPVAAWRGNEVPKRTARSVETMDKRKVSHDAAEKSEPSREKTGNTAGPARTLWRVRLGAVIFYGPVLLTVGSSGRSDHGCANAGSDTHVPWKPRRPG